jgi:hypothetical protein
MPVIGWQQGFKDSCGINAFGGEDAALENHAHCGSIGLNGANQNALRVVAFHDVGTQQAKRLAMLRPSQRGKFLLEFRRRFVRYSLARILGYFGQIAAPLPM